MGTGDGAWQGSADLLGGRDVPGAGQMHRQDRRQRGAGAGSLEGGGERWQAAVHPAGSESWRRSGDSQCRGQDGLAKPAQGFWEFSPQVFPRQLLSFSMGLVLLTFFSKPFLSLFLFLFSFPLPFFINPVEIKVIKDLPWPPPVGQLDSGESPPDGEAGAPVPPQHGQPSYEDTNGGSRGTVGVRGGCSWSPDICPSLFCIFSSSTTPLGMQQSSCTGGLFGGRVITFSFVLSSLPPNFQCLMAAFTVFSTTALMFSSDSERPGLFQVWQQLICIPPLELGLFIPVCLASSFITAPFLPLFYYLAAQWQEVPLDSSLTFLLFQTAKSLRHALSFQVCLVVKPFLCVPSGRAPT